MSDTSKILQWEILRVKGGSSVSDYQAVLEAGYNLPSPQAGLVPTGQV